MPQEILWKDSSNNFRFGMVALFLLFIILLSAYIFSRMNHLTSFDFLLILCNLMLVYLTIGIFFEYKPIEVVEKGLFIKKGKVGEFFSIEKMFKFKQVFVG